MAATARYVLADLEWSLRSSRLDPPRRVGAALKPVAVRGGAAGARWLEPWRAVKQRLAADAPRVGAPQSRVSALLKAGRPRQALPHAEAALALDPANAAAAQLLANARKRLDARVA